jgi:hypothetical protein
VQGLFSLRGWQLWCFICGAIGRIGMGCFFAIAECASNLRQVQIIEKVAAQHLKLFLNEVTCIPITTLHTDSVVITFKTNRTLDHLC